MHSQEDKEREAMLAAYIDGELGEEERLLVVRRLESGDARLIRQLEELQAVRREAREWFADLSAEMSSVDLWPSLESKLLAEQQSAQQSDRRVPQRSGILSALPRFVMGRSVRRGGEQNGQFGRGFSWGFAGGFAMAGCASMAMLVYFSGPQTINGISGSNQLAAAPAGDPAAVMPGTETSAGGAIATARVQERPTQLARETLSPSGATIGSVDAADFQQQEMPAIALVSAGRDVGSMEEITVGGTVYQLPADLFAEVHSRDRAFESQLVNEALSVQLLSPGNIAPSGIEELEVLARNGDDLATGTVMSGKPEAMASLGMRNNQPRPQTSPADVTWVSNTEIPAEVH